MWTALGSGRLRGRAALRVPWSAFHRENVDTVGSNEYGSMRRNDDGRVSRRALLGGYAGLIAVLAGCSGGGDGSPTPSDGPTTPTGTDASTATDTPTETESPTPEGPTVESFDYPPGATREGIAAAQLFDTHRDRLTSAGSATATAEGNTDYGEFTEPISRAGAVGESAVSSTSEGEQVTIRTYSPDGERSALVELSTGFESRYRIDNEAPSPRRLLRFRTFENLLRGVSWGGASEVVERDGSGGERAYAVAYESTGVADEAALLRVLFGESVQSVSARIEVASSGTVPHVEYDMTVRRERGEVRRTERIGTGAVGSTDVPTPPWASTARERGIRFKGELTDDNRLAALEMTNGGEVPSGTRASVSGRQFASGELSSAVTPGDVLYLGVTESEELVSGVNEQPSGATQFEGTPFVSLREGRFELFADSV